MTAVQPRTVVRFRARRGIYLIRGVIEAAIDDDVFGLAAQLAYYFLLSLFPFLLLLATLLPYLTAPGASDRLVNFIEPVIPESITELVQNNIQMLLATKRRGLLSFSVITLLWSASGGFNAVINGLNLAYAVHESRPFWKSRLMAVGMTVLIGILAFVSTVMLTFGHVMNNLAALYLRFPVIFWVIARWTVALAFLVLSLDLIYYMAPNVRHPWRWFSPGALLATTAWVAMSLGFSFYLSRFGRYEATYGALAAIITLMLWFYFSGVALLIGGELNSMLERRVRHDAHPRN